MSTLSEYFSIAKQHPDLFENPPSASFILILGEDEIHQIEAEVGEKLAREGLSAAMAQVGVAFQDQYILLLRDAVRFPEGSVDTCLRLVEEQGKVPGVCVLPLYKGQVALIRHFRHELRDWHLEIPGGFGLSGMSSGDSALREIEEEIEAKVARLVPLGRVHPDTGSGADYIELFFAEIESYGALEKQEGIDELLLIPLVEFERMVGAGDITDICVLVAYAHAKLQGLL